MYLTYTICSEYHNTTEVAYCVPYLHNMLLLKGAYCVGEHFVDPQCYLSSIMIFGAYCVGKVHNMLPWWYYDNGSILCR